MHKVICHAGIAQANQNVGKIARQQPHSSLRRPPQQNDAPLLMGEGQPVHVGGHKLQPQDMLVELPENSRRHVSRRKPHLGHRQQRLDRHERRRFLFQGGRRHARLFPFNGHVEYDTRGDDRREAAAKGSPVPARLLGRFPFDFWGR
jgi:hypothetical protein